MDKHTKASISISRFLLLLIDNSQVMRSVSSLFAKRTTNAALILIVLTLTYAFVLFTSSSDEMAILAAGFFCVLIQLRERPALQDTGACKQ